MNKGESMKIEPVPLQTNDSERGEGSGIQPNETPELILH